MNTSRAGNVTRNFTFPLSDELIDITTYRNSDGSFRSNECVIQLLKDGQMELNIFLLSGVKYEEESIYNLRFVSDVKIQIIKIKKASDGSFNFDSEKNVGDLAVSKICELRKRNSNMVEKLLTLFCTYHQNFQVTQPSIGRAQKPIHGELATLLRFVAGAKIRFLEDLFGSYLSFNLQAYFDVVSQVLASGADTLPALFTITGMHFRQHKSLCSKELLKEALKREFKDETGRAQKGELHFKNGLVTLYSRQMKIKLMINRRNKTIDEDDYQPIASLGDM